jgi:hypothetical protein
MWLSAPNGNGPSIVPVSVGIAPPGRWPSHPGPGEPTRPWPAAGHMKGGHGVTAMRATQQLCLSALWPRGAFDPRGQNPDRAGLGAARSPGPMGCPGEAQGRTRTPPTDLTKERQPRCRRYRRATKHPGREGGLSGRGVCVMSPRSPVRRSCKNAYGPSALPPVPDPPMLVGVPEGTGLDGPVA